MHVILNTGDASLDDKLRKALDRPDIICDEIRNTDTACARVPNNTCDIFIVTDYRLGSDPVNYVKSVNLLPDAPAIVVFTDKEDADRRAELLGWGCEAVLNKTLSPRKILGVFETIFNSRRENFKGSITPRTVPSDTRFADFISESPVMQKLMKLADRASYSDSTLLILGETGAGKERLANAIHSEGHRSEQPFLAVNCGALPESLLESELFGHEAGAFTGAAKARRGCFELAHMGTLFLDEIGEIPLHLQVKLLRAIERREITRIGGEKTLRVNVRIIAATNKNLEEEAEQGRFRKDLFYRLNVVALTIPPLRERRQDIPSLVESYIQYFRFQIATGIKYIEKQALAALCDYHWPGNVRELINVIERAILLCDGDTITISELPDNIVSHGAQEITGSNYKTADEFVFPENLFEIPLKQAQKLLIEKFEKIYLSNVLNNAQGRIGITARFAGIDERTLFTKMKNYGFDKKTFTNKR